MPASTTRAMPCHLLACFLAGQGCGAGLPHCRQEWLNGQKHLMTVSCGSKGALSSSVLAGGTADMHGCADTAPLQLLPCLTIGIWMRDVTDWGWAAP